MPLCGVSLLRYNLALLRNAGVRDVVVNTHHLAAEMEKGALEIGREVDVSVTISREVGHILGTGGGVRRAATLLGPGTFLLLNGDMLFDVDLEAAMVAHRTAGAMATMVLAPYPRGASYGAVEVDASFNVRRIAGRGAPAEPGLTKMHFTGVHVLESEVLSRLPAEFPAAIVVVQHVEPSRHSLMSDIIGRRTALPVKEAAEGDQLLAGHVYFAPPDHRRGEGVCAGPTW